MALRTLLAVLVALYAQGGAEAFAMSGRSAGSTTSRQVGLHRSVRVPVDIDGDVSYLSVQRGEDPHVAARSFLARKGLTNNDALTADLARSILLRGCEPASEDLLS